METWKEIGNNYEISNMGNCRRKYLKGYKDIKGCVKNTGYKYIQVWENDKKVNKYVHQLVIKHFCGDRPEGLCIDHKDRNKLNNSVENLHYVSYSDNAKNSNRINKIAY